ncbi:MAG TPA: FAD-binding oxidoreductase, partial [Actinomycetota bacterium]|nr:FAD-binding oxidoreductase [Actinomycetota bacterium]
KAMGGVRQQFSTQAEVLLAQASIRFFERLGAPFFDQVGYLFLATTEAGLAELEDRAELQRSLGVPVVATEPPDGVQAADVLGAVICRQDGVANPPAVARELVRRAVERGVEVREGEDATRLEGDAFVIASGPWSAEVGRELGVELPIRPLCRQLLETGTLESLPDDLPMIVEAETGFHFRRRGDRLVLAMSDPEPRWGFDEVVDETLFEDRLARLAHRYPSAAGTRIEGAWAGLYDMTPDAHPILGPVGEGVFAACGFSGHGFMQSPAVGRAVAEEVLGLSPSFDLAAYRLDRFEAGAVFPEKLIL